MVPDAALLVDVLPTDRLQASGMPKPELREQLRRIPNGRNVANVASVWVQSFGVLAVATWLDRWWGWAIAFLLMGRAFALYAILGHEAAHRLLFSNRRVNDLIGRWGLSYPAFVPFDLYRRSHFAHHRDEMGPNEPDLAFYRGYPITPGLDAAQAHPRCRPATRDGRTSRACWAPSAARWAGRWRCASWPPRWWWPRW